MLRLWTTIANGLENSRDLSAAQRNRMQVRTHEFCKQQHRKESNSAQPQYSRSVNIKCETRAMFSHQFCVCRLFYSCITHKHARAHQYIGYSRQTHTHRHTQTDAERKAFTHQIENNKDWTEDGWGSAARVAGKHPVYPREFVLSQFESNLIIVAIQRPFPR